MNPQLVACLFASTAIGVAAFALVLASGAGLLLALLAYSFGGSLALVSSSIVACQFIPA